MNSARILDEMIDLKKKKSIKEQGVIKKVRAFELLQINLSQSEFTNLTISNIYRSIEKEVEETTKDSSYYNNEPYKMVSKDISDDNTTYSKLLEQKEKLVDDIHVLEELESDMDRLFLLAIPNDNDITM